MITQGYRLGLHGWRSQPSFGPGHALVKSISHKLVHTRQVSSSERKHRELHTKAHVLEMILYYRPTPLFSRGVVLFVVTVPYPVAIPEATLDSLYVFHQPVSAAMLIERRPSLCSRYRDQDCGMHDGWSWPSGVTAEARSDISHFMSSTKFLMTSDRWPGYAPTETPGLNFGACCRYESPALPSPRGNRRAHLLSLETEDEERGPSDKKISNQSVHPQKLRTCRHRRSWASQGPCCRSTGRWPPLPPSACTAPPSAA